MIPCAASYASTRGVSGTLSLQSSSTHGAALQHTCGTLTWKSPRSSRGKRLAARSQKDITTGHSEKRKPLKLPKPENAALGMSAAGGSMLMSLSSLLEKFGGGDGKGGKGSSGGGGGGGGGDGGAAGQQPDKDPLVVEDDAAEGAEEEQEFDDDDDAEKGSDDPDHPVQVWTREELGSNFEGERQDGSFFVDALIIENLPKSPGVPTVDQLFVNPVPASCLPNSYCSRDDVSKDLQRLMEMGLTEKVDVKVLPKRGQPGHFTVRYIFEDKKYPPLTSIKVTPIKQGQKLLFPTEELQPVIKELQGKELGIKEIARIKNTVDEWYLKHNYPIGYVGQLTGLETGKVNMEVVEGRVNSVYPTSYAPRPGADPSDLALQAGGGGLQGNLPMDYILDQMPYIKRGEVYNAAAGRRLLHDLINTQLVETCQVIPRQDQEDITSVDVEVMVQEKPVITTEVQTEWAFAPDDNKRPTLVSYIPGGQITVTHNNVAGRAQQLSASVQAQNLLQPADDLGFRVEYRDPFWRTAAADELSGAAAKKMGLTATAFNTRKVSPVFTPGTAGEQDPPAVFVDRIGGKVMIDERFGRHSTITNGLVLEQVTTRDESGQAISSFKEGGRDGPATTLSASGTDRLLALQCNILRDTTYYVNGTLVGARDNYQLDQGLGIGPLPLFNRHAASWTRFLQLRPCPAGDTSPPPVLVLHAKYGGCIGALPPYDAFLLGGPHSVRGFDAGEVAVARRAAEAAVELRWPVLGKQVYAFAEHGTDLGSSSQVRGNPSEYFRRPGSGTSYGAGVKVGPVRVEWATNSRTGKPTLFARFGERF